jgi:TPR repeat protein
MVACLVWLCVAPPVFGGAPPLERDEQETLVALLKAQNFAELERQLNAHLSAYLADTQAEHRAVSAFEAFGRRETDLEAPFDQWIANSPREYAAHLARGIYYMTRAWERRGEKYARETPPHRLDEMEQFFALARRDLDRSLTLHPRPALTYKYLINMAKAGGRRSRDARGYLDAALKLDPYLSGARRAYMHGLRPEWGGSFEAMQVFLEETRGYPAHEKLGEIVSKLEADILARRCRAEAHAGRHAAALEYCNRAVAKVEEAGILGERAWVLRELNRLEEALADATRALEKDPDYTWARQERSWLLGRLGRKDEAVAEYVRLAEQGALWAQAQLGRMYALGESGVKRDHEQARKWLERAAAEGDSTGQLWLGILYMEGTGVARDDAEAYRLFRLAAEQGEPSAMNNVGFFLWHGRATEVQQLEAIRWWRKAAGAGSKPAAQNLERYPSWWQIYLVQADETYEQAKHWARDFIVGLVYVIFR